MSFLGGLTSNISNLLSFIGDGFVIVDTESLTSYKFDTYTLYSMTKENQVPTQPVESASFAVDSKIIAPRKINIVARKANTLLQTVLNQTQLPGFLGVDNISIADFKSALLQLADSPNIVNLIINNKFTSYSENYTFYTLESVNWNITPDELSLVANMVFVEVRQSNISFTNVPNPLNPTDKAQQNNGITTPTQPTTAQINSLLLPQNPTSYFLGK